MNPDVEGMLKADPAEWAVYERANNLAYWQDRAKHGSGLIKDIAAFVMESKTAKHGEAGD